jgi:hypothetical protein
MKTQSIPGIFLLLSAILICNLLFFQSCSPNNDIAPKNTPSTNVVTVKVIDMSDGSGSITSQLIKHFRIVTNDATQQTILDTNIIGNYVYSFASKMPSVSLTATLTSASDFVSAIEVDANGKMEAYHNGSCAGTQYQITDNISF